MALPGLPSESGDECHEMVIAATVEARRAVFVDRDGVINRGFVRDGKPYPPATLDEFEFLPGVEAGLEALKAAGFLIIVVTNQPDVATGVQRREVVDQMHDRIRRLLPVDDVRVCFHVDADGCQCRKPRPGMLLDAAASSNVSLPDSFMVGDRWRDIDAGKAAGCSTVLIDCDYNERRAEAPDAIAATLLDASELILAWGHCNHAGR